MMFSNWQDSGRIMLWKQESIHGTHCGTILPLGVVSLHHSTHLQKLQCEVLFTGKNVFKHPPPPTPAPPPPRAHAPPPQPIK